MRKVAIVGIGHTGFGNLSEFDLVDVMGFAACSALQDAGVLQERRLVEQLLVSNMCGGIINHQTGIASALVSRLGMEPAMAELVENGPASGASAVKLAVMAIASGLADTALVVGGELMRAVTGWIGTDAVATLLHPQAEYDLGLTLPAFGGIFTRMYMERYGLTERELAMVAVKDHENAAKNPWAHVRVPCTLEAIHDGENADVVNNYVAEPLRLYGMCPVSDGAAALLLCALDSPKMKHFQGKPPVLISGIGAATDRHCVHERQDPLRLEAVRLSAERAYAMAGLGPKDICFAELHDAFVILEIAISEEVGFFERGKAREGIVRGETRIDGRIPLNTSGGLKAKGHPVGATGASMHVLLHRQLIGEPIGASPARPPSIGVLLNVGGSGVTNCVTVLARE